MRDVTALLGGLGSAVVAGVFFAFSFLVVPGLRRTAEHGADTMRSINQVAVRPTFMTVLFGTAAVLIAGCFTGRQTVLAVAAVTGYAVGVIGVTAGFHVPRNDALATGRISWSRYLREWSAGNHVRTAAAAVAAVLAAARAVA